MKNLFRAVLILAILIHAFTGNTQTLFTYGKYSVSKDEFLRAYTKNNMNAEQLTEKSLREYLDLYIPFKLKVQAAYDLKLDTLPSQRAELQAFRNQLVQGFLTDPGSLSKLVDEAFERSQRDIRISHIFIPAPKDSAAQVQRLSLFAKEAHGLLKQGKEFGEVALVYSNDPSVQNNRGDIGYITVFSLPYELETLAYNTPLNGISEVYQSNAGFHIFKKTGERKAIGKMKIAQILLAFPPEADNATKTRIKQKADSLYNELKKGADFAKAATDHSNDNFSFQQGGELPEFGAGRYDAPFELAAFALQKDGDISQPILTEYGYHIIKRLSARPVPTDKNNRDYRSELEQQVQNDARMEISKKAFFAQVLRNINYKKGNYNAEHLWAYTDSILLNRPVPANTSINSTKTIFSFAKQNITVNDWLAFRRSVGGVDRITSGRSAQQLMDYYLDLAAMEYYRNHLEEFNKDFAFQLKEFKDGNLLFEVMQRKIWDKASSDSAGLKKYFNQHKNNYWWENSATAILFTAMNDSIARDLRPKVERNISGWRSLTETYEGNVIADSGRFEISQLPLQANAGVTAKTLTPFMKNESDSTITFAYIIQLFPQREPRSFEDARGYVINDYQQFLEAAWVAELRKRYPVKVNDVVLRSMVK